MEVDKGNDSAKEVWKSSPTEFQRAQLAQLAELDGNIEDYEIPSRTSCNANGDLKRLEGKAVPVKHKPATPSNVLLATAVIVTLALCCSDANGAKLQLWRELLGTSLGPLAGYGPIERLAQRLSEWPDQRRAALLYLSLVARRAPEGACLRSSLAELTSPTGALEGVATAGEQLSQRVELDQLAWTGEEASQLEQVPAALAASQLAVKLANLISRLSIGGSGIDEDNESQREEEAESLRRGLAAERELFKYQLETELGRLAAKHPAVHSAALVFHRLPSSHQEAKEKKPGDIEFGWLVRTAGAQGLRPGGLELREHPVAGNSSNPNAYFLPGPRPQPFWAKWWLSRAQLGPLASRLAPGGKLASGEPAPELAVRDGRWFSPYLDCGLANRWLLTYSVPFFGSSAADSNQQRREEQPSRGPITFRGVSLVTLDFGRLGLLDQCGGSGGDDDLGDLGGRRGAFLAGTHECARIEASQCARIAAPEAWAGSGGLLSGQYVCVCPAGHQIEANERRASAEFGEHLAEELPFDLGLFELDERLADRRWARDQLQRRGWHQAANGSGAETEEPEAYLAPGARLQWESWLAWLSSPHHQAVRWPRRACRPCPADEEDSCAGLLAPGGHPESPNQLEAVQAAQAAPQRPTTATTSALLGHWIRPLVLALHLFCLLVTIGLLALLIRVRKSRIIMASGWLMLETMLLGALLLYTSVLVRVFEPVTSITCLLVPWLAELGFSILYGSILIKLYRILTEFQTRKAHRVCLRDKDQLVYLLAIVAIVTGYMSAWTALMFDGLFYRRATADQLLAAPEPSNAESEPKLAANGSLLEQVRGLMANRIDSIEDLFSGLLEEQRLDQLEVLHHQREEVPALKRCRSLTWDYVTELSEMGLLLFGLYLVYKLRNASAEQHKEKLVLSVSIFTQLLVSGLAYAIRHALWEELEAEKILLLHSIRCQLTVTVTLVLVFGPKLWTIGKSKPGLFSSGARLQGGSSMRHRCHISCELHDHHLDDAMRLHQAMLSNAALDIGSINLADMDPDEIQAELKRVYAQLEMLKTKAMRRDNPHISKRRGGRKSGHRKFSLQAFHAKHLAPHAHHNSGQQQQNSNQPGHQLPAKKQALKERPEEEAAAAAQVEVAASKFTPTHQHQHRQHNQHHQHQRYQQAPARVKPQRTNSKEPPTTTGGYFINNNDDDTLMINDSPSSGNLSPQRQSSFVCSQSSIHPEESSLG